MKKFLISLLLLIGVSVCYAQSNVIRRQQTKTEQTQTHNRQKQEAEAKRRQEARIKQEAEAKRQQEADAQRRKEDDAKLYNKVFEAVEQPPQFPGGDVALQNFVSQNLKYPISAQKNNIQGRVVVQFVVTRSGSIGEVKIIRGKDLDLDMEAVRVVKSLPKFQPGMQNGVAVDVWYTLPITFRLAN